MACGETGSVEKPQWISESGRAHRINGYGAAAQRKQSVSFAGPHHALNAKLHAEYRKVTFTNIMDSHGRSALSNAKPEDIARNAQRMSPMVGVAARDPKLPLTRLSSSSWLSSSEPLDHLWLIDDSREAL